MILMNEEYQIDEQWLFGTIVRKSYEEWKAKGFLNNNGWWLITTDCEKVLAKFCFNL